MGRLLTGPQPSRQVRDQGLGMAFAAPPGAVYLLSTLLGDLHTNSPARTVQPQGRYASPKRSSTRPHQHTASADTAGREPMAGVTTRPHHSLRGKYDTQNHQRVGIRNRSIHEVLMVVSPIRFPRFVDALHPPMKQANLRRE